MRWGHVDFEVLVGHPRGDSGVPTFLSNSSVLSIFEFDYLLTLSLFALSFLPDLFVLTSLPSSSSFFCDNF